MWSSTRTLCYWSAHLSHGAFALQSCMAAAVEPQEQTSCLHFIVPHPQKGFSHPQTLSNTSTDTQNALQRRTCSSSPPPTRWDLTFSLNRKLICSCWRVRFLWWGKQDRLTVTVKYLITTKVSSSTWVLSATLYFYSTTGKCGTTGWRLTPRKLVSLSAARQQPDTLITARRFVHLHKLTFQIQMIFIW